jgi:competence protein ComEC
LVFEEITVRRPVIFLFLSFIFGIALEYYLILGPFHFLFFAFILALSYFTSRIMKWQQERVRLACLFLAVVMIGSVYFYLSDNSRDPLESAEGKIRTVEGRIVTVRIKDAESWQMLITAQGVGKRLMQIKGAPGEPAEYVGKWAVVRGTVSLPAERRNPGLFDYRLYLKTRDVRVILQCNSGQITLRQDKSSLIFSQIAGLKYGFMDKLEQEMEPEAYGLMVGMLFGDCSFISDDTYEAFQKNGIAHILSVSGIHVGIVYLFVNRLLGSRKTRTFYLITALTLVLYAALSEFSPPVVRAVVMIFIHMFSKVSYRRYDFITCTSASALGMLIVNPFYLFNVGFQLSYLAVFCLAALLPWANRKIDFIEGGGRHALLAEALRYLSPLLIIQIGMAPVTAYLFNYFSVVSFFLNAPIIALSGVMIPLGIFLIPASFLGGPIFGVGAQAAELLVESMQWLNQLFYLPGISFFNAVSPPIFLILVFYGFFFFLTSEYLRILYQRGRQRAIALCCTLIVLLSAAMAYATDSGYHDADMVFIDVGQGA